MLIGKYWKQPAISNREIEVLVRVSSGMKYSEIAQELFVEVCTVKRHMVNIYNKLGASNQPEAIEQGYLKPKEGGE